VHAGAAPRTLLATVPARLALTILAVSDLPRAVRFYREAFAWPLVVDLPVFAQFRLPGETGVCVYQQDTYAANTRQPPAACAEGEITGTELYLLVDDLDDAMERLRAAGARELAAPEPKPWGDTAAYFADPDGNVIAVAVHSEE